MSKEPILKECACGNYECKPPTEDFYCEWNREQNISKCQKCPWNLWQPKKPVGPTEEHPEFHLVDREAGTAFSPVEPTCPECKGYGQIRSEDLTGEGQQTFYLECAVCNGTGEAPADLQPAEPIDEMSQYLRQTCVYRDTCVSTMKCRNCGVFMAEPVKPEAGRQVSRDFDTIEHEAEMPLREQFHRVLSRMDKPTWGGGISWNEALNWMVLIIEAHDSAVAAKAVKEFAEKVREWKQVIADSYVLPIPVDRVQDMLDDLIVVASREVR